MSLVVVTCKFFIMFNKPCSISFVEMETAEVKEEVQVLHAQPYSSALMFGVNTMMRSKQEGMADWSP